MLSKDLQEPSIKRYGQFKFFTNSQKNAILRAISPWERCKVNFLTKKATHPRRNLVIFSKKMVPKNNDFRFKNMNNTKNPKMTSKGVQEPLIKSYEQIWNFENSEISDLFPPGKTARY